MLSSLLFALAVSVPAVSEENDPFLWLEEVESARSLDWVRARNQGSAEKLRAHPNYAPIEAELRSIYSSSARLPGISLWGKTLRNFWQDAGHPRGIWRQTSLESYRTGNTAWELLLDLDELNRREGKNLVWKRASCLEPEGRRCLLELSPGGGDAVEIREFDVVARSFVENGFRLPVGKHRHSWISADEIFIGTDFGPGSLSESGYPIVVKRWKRGTKLEEASEIYRGQPTDISATAHASFQPGWKPQFITRQLSFFDAEVYLLDEKGATQRLPLPVSADFQELLGNKAFFLLREELKTRSAHFPAGSLVAYPLLRAAEGAASLDGLELVFAPSGTRFLSAASRSGNLLLLSVLDNVRGKILRARRGGDGWHIDELALGTNGMASLTGSSAYSDEILASYMDFTTPTSQFHGNSRTGKLEPLRSSPRFFDSRGLITEQLEAVSKDGTKIPFFVTRRADLPRDGSHPTLLYGYGGFNISLTPWYSASAGKAWLERGGIYVVANIRGGGEFGPAWHEAARKEKHQNAFDDFIAVAEKLIAEKLTSPRHLGIEGGSNGGLLVGAVMVQRPELFNAVLCEVPLLDMLRYHKLLAGASWVGEYGNPDVSSEREYIARYSPYQNLSREKRYPEVFFTTSTRDDRVHPGHARKMAARMESLGHSVLYFENTEGGHGGSATPEQRAQLAAMSYSYLWMKLGR